MECRLLGASGFKVPLNSASGRVLSVARTSLAARVGPELMAPPARGASATRAVRQSM